ncbi:CoA transferase [Mycobacterium sp. CBMA293]|uniref:CaiB/BaiF CoA transferase family protein n=1 Tax=unclassified Mycolicibacterium TaxID=2636767 RepID=UPI0012DE368C|nr:MULTISPECIES: CoA transferase [unclassified Mycolicibacterium]MUL49474.1 CoA transferase [Mycolicibacterium sp. CBMA 360]MUL57255.1 CoA transferase [Mycolicibacterium sp. CBMA 335]MUL70295.1 CoA transferase [Mycolicibacterium sp. CBMA 311]MUL92343.1 CoA transferase [Mycolicibacterium sp. CBMA 230]MUM06764.1 CoA transferase [Mycolicibacterium sp. CBMA 213]
MTTTSQPDQLAAGVLSGIRVVDFGKHVAGPWCGALLADLGAEVIRVERPSGGDDRYIAPVAEDGSGAMYLVCNRGKRGMTLSAYRDDAEPIVSALLESADVVVANLPAATRKRMGIDWESLHAKNPRAVLVTATAFGDDGPYADRIGFDGTIQAMSGAIALSGEPGEPTRCWVPYIDFATGSLLAMGVLAALMARDRTGVGQHVDGSLMNTGLLMGNRETVESQVLGVRRQPTGNRGQTSGPFDVFATTDGFVMASVVGDRQFVRWCELVGRPELLEDPRFATDTDRGRNGAGLSEVFASWCADRSNDEVMRQLSTAGIAAGPVLRPEELLEDPQVRFSSHLVDTVYPGLDRPAPIADFPVSLSATPGRIRGAAPTLGADTDQVLAELGFAPDRVAQWRADGIV